MGFYTLNRIQTETWYAKELFNKFTMSLPKVFFNRTINFSYIYYWFSWQKMDKVMATEIVDIWVKNRLCAYVKYHGIKLGSDTSLNSRNL